MGSVFLTSGTGGAKMSILLVEWGLGGGHTGSQNEGFVCPPSGAGWWGQWESKWGGPLDVVEFGVKEHGE